ncbi:MAG: hypothetical protein ACO2YR_05305 [Nitrosopumilaceae archaeon]
MSGFLGDQSKKIVHHLANMKPRCKIYQIEIKDREYFTPDTIEKAKSKEYESCEFCND